MWREVFFGRARHTQEMGEMHARFLQKGVFVCGRPVAACVWSNNADCANYHSSHEVISLVLTIKLQKQNFTGECHFCFMYLSLFIVNNSRLSLSLVSNPPSVSQINSCLSSSFPNHTILGID